MSILNAVRMGRFSSDRSIQEYCDRIWNVSPSPVALDDHTQWDGPSGSELACKLH